jgi:hypothetical protein
MRNKRPSIMLVLLATGPLGPCLYGCSEPQTPSAGDTLEDTSSLWPADEQSWEATLAAETDIRDGNLKLKSYGTPALWIAEYARILEVDYGIEFERVAGCIVTREIVQYADCYNKRMKQEIFRRYGDDVLEKAAKRAREIWRNAQ